MTTSTVPTPAPEQATAWLRRAIDQRHEPSARKWLEAGADPCGVSGAMGTSMLAHAIDQGATVQMCQILLDHGALLAPDESDRSLLHRAAVQGNPGVCEEIIKRGARVDERSPEDMTPLMTAAGQGHAEACEVLIHAGADVHAVGVRGFTPLHMAAKCWNDERALKVVKLLIAHGASPAFAPHRHKKWYLTPFQAAVQTGCAPVVKYLIHECGQSPGQVTAGGRKMLEIASKDEVKQLLGMLLVEQAVASTLADAGLPSGVVCRDRSTFSPL